MGTKTMGGIVLFFLGSVAVLVCAVLWGAAPAKTTSAHATAAHERHFSHGMDDHPAGAGSVRPFRQLTSLVVFTTPGSSVQSGRRLGGGASNSDTSTP